MQSQFLLFRERRFLPLFTVQFLGAFNDNFAKSLYVVLLAYGIWDSGAHKPEVLVSLAAAVFILPFIIFTPIAGVMADRFDKAKMIRWIKIAEVGIVAIAIFALYAQSVLAAMVVLFLLGVQSAFFSPCKFSILPQHLNREELLAGNALVSSGTYIAILGGTMLGAFLIPLEGGYMIASAILVVAALVGLGAAFYVPPALPSKGEKQRHFLYECVSSYKVAAAQKNGVVWAILGTAWFYFIAATFHAQFPNFSKMALSADPNVLGIFMVVFSIGIALGGLLNHRLLRAQVSLRYVPWAAAAVGVFGLDLYFASSAFPIPKGDELYSPSAFFFSVEGLRVSVDLFLLAAAAGFYVIPLRALVQDRVMPDIRARVISISNMSEAVFILASAMFAAFVFSYDARVEELYLIVCGASFFIGAILFILRMVRGKCESMHREDAA